MKACFKCGQEKSLDQFYKHSQMADGHLNKCKECTKKDVLNHREKNLESIRAYDRKRGGLKHRIQNNTERTKRFRKQFPERYKAHSKLNNAVRGGIIIKPELCSACESDGQIEAHHDDYSKPLNIVWLCSICHKKLHIDLIKTEKNHGRIKSGIQM